jgi:hypothetical protein
MLSSELIALIVVGTAAILLVAWLVRKLMSCRKQTEPNDDVKDLNDAKRSDQKESESQQECIENSPTDYEDGQPDRDRDNFELTTIIFTPHRLAFELGHEHYPTQISFNDVMELLRGSAEVWRNPNDSRIKFDNLLRVIDFLVHDSKDKDRNNNPVHHIGYEIMARAGCREPISPLQAAQVLAALSVSNKLELVSLSSTRGRRYLQLLRSFVGDSRFRPENSPRKFFFEVEFPNKRYRPAGPSKVP